MTTEIQLNKADVYRQCEDKAAHYFQELMMHLSKRTYVSNLTNDFQIWKQKHINQPSLFSFLSRKKSKPDTKDYYLYIKWLNYTGKLDDYLDRSISYIYMRDLGKALDSEDTQERVHRVVDSLSESLTSSSADNSDHLFSMAGLYRIAEKEGVEDSFIWLIDKLKLVSANIPAGMDAEEAKRKLIKIIAGVLLQQWEELGDDLLSEERAHRLTVALHLGYCYGLTYPFIDDLLDANILSLKENKHYTDLIRTTLTTGVVPKLGDWPSEKNQKFIRFVHSELREAFEYIKSHQPSSTWKEFLDQAYVFFTSQEVDRAKDLTNPNYTNEELFIPVILKAASSRQIVRSIINADEDDDTDNRIFCYGIYNQLADDFTDMYSDLEADAVTPYTYYLTYHESRTDLINPFELYWTVISYLIHNVFHSDEKTREVILDRAINGLKRLKVRVGHDKYNEIMELFALDSVFNRVVQKMVDKAEDVDFFDKLLRDHIITTLKTEREEKDNFRSKIEEVRKQVNSVLPITNNDVFTNDFITSAANYSLQGDAKRLRPIMTWFIGTRTYHLDEKTIMPLLRSLEYMHTASLIYDDLPSQDNAAFRRGRPTVHEWHNVATAELTGLFLTQKAVEQQAALEAFDSKKVLQLIQYSAQTTADMCRGQAMDLESKGKSLTLDQLNTMCFYKTGIGFEASLIMPAILAGAAKKEIDKLKKFAYHAGIAFQIKDDLLDVEGEHEVLGKPTEQDTKNNNATFVSVLGQVGAKKAVWNHYCLAMETLQQLPEGCAFLKQLLHYIVHRNH